MNPVVGFIFKNFGHWDTLMCQKLFELPKTWRLGGHFLCWKRRERDTQIGNYWNDSKEVINGLTIQSSAEIAVKLFSSLSPCLLYFQKRRQKKPLQHFLVDYTSCNRFQPNNAVCTAGTISIDVSQLQNIVVHALLNSDFSIGFMTFFP